MGLRSDTPDESQVAQITLGWIDEWMQGQARSEGGAR
jgi:hypothetical protein